MEPAILARQPAIVSSTRQPPTGRDLCTKASKQPTRGKNEKTILANQTGFFDITAQLASNHPLLALALAQVIDGSEWESTFASIYSDQGRKAKPIRRLCGLLMLKQLYQLSDENVVQQWQMNPYYQLFCGETRGQTSTPCHSTERVTFRQGIGEQGVKKIFGLCVALHGDAAEEATVLVDTTVQEKAITYPTDTKLAIKIIKSAFFRADYLLFEHTV